MNASAAAVFPGATAVLSLLLLMIGRQVWCHPLGKPLSPVLIDDNMYNIVKNISHEAQNLVGDDGSIRLIPQTNTNTEDMKICCLHANILNYYLTNILYRRDDSSYPGMETLKINLHRISKDLKAHGCKVHHYHEHPKAVAFRNKLELMGEEGMNKAVGEIDILFSYLQDACVQSRKFTTSSSSGASTSTSFASSTNSEAL